MISEFSKAPLSKVFTILSKYEVEYFIVGGNCGSVLWISQTSQYHNF
jgi:hypothetical protein